ncbi:hypothetical protein ACFOWB_03010 [Chenggangzhangella methanolivorans]|uniref:hypothetical protein n=1 Tax=Chenggangzhangella methanolivorans TaxID=1437009 RepID=UPI00360F9AAF
MTLSVPGSVPPGSTTPEEAPPTTDPAWDAALVNAQAAPPPTEDAPPAEAEAEGQEPETDPTSMSESEIRDEYDIPDFAGDGVLDIKVEGDTTVATKATEDFVQGLRDDLESGKIEKGSDEAKLLDLIDAQGAIDNGYDLYGYAEEIQTGAGTYRESQDSPTHLNGLDVKEMVDEKKVAEGISELMGKEGIAKRYDDALKATIDGVPSEALDGIKSKTMEGLFKDGEPNTAFEDYVIDMKEKATAAGDEELADKIDKEVGNYFDALNYFEPEKFADRKQQFDQNMMTHQLDEYVSDPESIDPENLDAGLRATVDVWQSAINGGLQIADKGSKAYKEAEALNAYFKDFADMSKNLSAEDSAKVNMALRSVWMDLKPVGGGPLSESDQARLREISDKVIGEKLDSLSTDDRNAFRKFVDGGAKTGTFGALTGTMGFVSAGVQLSNGGWSEMTSDEQIAAVRDLVGGLSQANDFSKFGSNLVNLGTKSDATAWLGLLDDNFPDIWKGESKVDSEIAKGVTKEINTASDKLANSDLGLDLGNLSEDDKKEFDKALEKLGDKMGDAPDASTAKKLGRTFVRFMGGAGLDVTGGVMDIVTGVRTLQKADTELEKAGAGLSIGGGSATTAMATMNTIKMFAPNGSNLAARLGGNIGARVVQGLAIGSRVLGPVLGVAGAVFGIAGALIAEAVAHQKMQKLTDSQGEFFGRLADQGVAAGDWGDKLEYARYASFMYGGRDAPDDRSMFDFQAEEWKHFQETEGERGSSLNRLAPYLHVDSNLNEKNLFEKYLAGQTSRPGPRGYSFETDDARPWDDTDMEAGTEGLEGDKGYISTSDYYRINVGRVYDAKFYDDHRKDLDVIVDRWDDWNGSDSIVSEKDLNKIVEETDNDDERNAAQFLLNNADFRRAVDGIRESGNQDTKISSKDLNAWLEMVTTNVSV